MRKKILICKERRKFLSKKVNTLNIIMHFAYNTLRVITVIEKREKTVGKDLLCALNVASRYICGISYDE